MELKFRHLNGRYLHDSIIIESQVSDEEDDYCPKNAQKKYAYRFSFVIPQEFCDGPRSLAVISFRRNLKYNNVLLVKKPGRSTDLIIINNNPPLKATLPDYEEKLYAGQTYIYS
jgi:hypothetical protein